jgi:undecaprenyl-diphosphatase
LSVIDGDATYRADRDHRWTKPCSATPPSVGNLRRRRRAFAFSSSANHHPYVHALIVWTAQYLLWLMAAGFAATWLLLEAGSTKVHLAAEAALGLALALAFLYVAKSVHHDPRPFVQNPHIRPLFAHGRDDGFPSDHSLAAGLIATLVWLRHRLLGLLFIAAALAIAWARVAAHVHHLQDVVTGLLLGALASILASLVVPPVLTRLAGRRQSPKPKRAALADNG